MPDFEKDSRKQVFDFLHIESKIWKLLSIRNFYSYYLRFWIIFSFRDKDNGFSEKNEIGWNIILRKSLHA